MSDTNITSINQMGGVTAHTVNFGPQARGMTDSLGSQIKDNIPTDAKIKVVAALGDGEALSFANQILQWLKDNGYDNASGVDQAVWSKPVVGQNLNKKGDKEFEILIGTKIN